MSRAITASSLWNVSASCGTAPVAMVEDDLLENVRADMAPNVLAANAPSGRYVPPPHPYEKRLIFKNIGRQDWSIDIDCYMRNGGYEQLAEGGRHVAHGHCERGEDLRAARARRRRDFHAA
jgi:hypothetical protein